MSRQGTAQLVQGNILRCESRRLVRVMMEDGSIERARCCLKYVESMKRSTSCDLFSIEDGDTFVCVDAMEPMRLALAWLPGHLKETGVHAEPETFFIQDTRRSFLCVPDDGTDMFATHVMGTSLARDQVAYLPEMPSKALNEGLQRLLINTFTASASGKHLPGGCHGRMSPVSCGPGRHAPGPPDSRRCVRKKPHDPCGFFFCVHLWRNRTASSQVITLAPVFSRLHTSISPTCVASRSRIAAS